MKLIKIDDDDYTLLKEWLTESALIARRENNREENEVCQRLLKAIKNVDDHDLR